MEPSILIGNRVPSTKIYLMDSPDRSLSRHRSTLWVSSLLALLTSLLEILRPMSLSDIIESVRDGFQLAEEDLKLRGPGEFFGTRQSGLPDLRMAKISDVALLERTRAEALRLFEEDRQLDKPEHALLVKEMSRVWAAEAGEWS